MDVNGHEWTGSQVRLRFSRNGLWVDRAGIMVAVLARGQEAKPSPRIDVDEREIETRGLLQSPPSGV
jgi:hypothetical protein